jgi:protein involved in polysaccharide export with SLBB domain
MRAVASALFLLALVACSPNQLQTPETRDPAVIDLGKHLYMAATLGAGDIFEVRVYQDKELSGKYRVGPDGSIDFPLIGKVFVEAKTPSEVTEVLKAKLSEGYLKNPSVTVFVVEYSSKKVYVLGQVKRPGTYAFEEGMNVVQAITVANGFADHADENGTIITRIENGREKRYLVPVDQISKGLSSNFSLKPGDIVFVPESIL